MSEVVTGRAAGEGFRFLSRQRLAEYVIVAAIIVESVVFASITPQFLSVPNLINVALSIAITGILAVGMTMVILTGGIDLSVGSVVALAGVVAASLAASSGGTGGVLLGVLVALAIGVGVALVIAAGAVLFVRARAPHDVSHPDVEFRPEPPPPAPPPTPPTPPPAP